MNENLILPGNINQWKKTYSELVAHPEEDPLTLIAARRQYVIDDTRTPYMDFTGGAGCMPLGHGHEVVGQAIAELGKFFYQTGPWGAQVHGVEMEYLHLLGQHFDSQFKWVFLSSENEAWTIVPSMLGLLPSEVFRVNYGAPRSIETLRLSVATGQSKAVVVSPVNEDTYGTINAAVLHEIIQMRSDHGIRIIWDETVAGMGWRGTSVFNTPFYADGVVLGGALGGGIPLSAVAMRDPGSPGALNTRLWGSAMAFTAGLHTLRQVMVLSANTDATGLVERLDDELSRLQELFPKDVARVLGEGLLRTLEFHTDTMAKEFVVQCRADGVLLAKHDRFVRIAVPLVCGLQDVDELISVLTESMMKVRERHGG